MVIMHRLMRTPNRTEIRRADDYADCEEEGYFKRAPASRMWVDQDLESLAERFIRLLDPLSACRLSP